jgi:hypothetical protein
MGSKDSVFVVTQDDSRVDYGVIAKITNNLLCDYTILNVDSGKCRVTDTTLIDMIIDGR